MTRFIKVDIDESMKRVKRRHISTGDMSPHTEVRLIKQTTLFRWLWMGIHVRALTQPTSSCRTHSRPGIMACEYLTLLHSTDVVAHVNITFYSFTLSPDMKT